MNRTRAVFFALLAIFPVFVLGCEEYSSPAISDDGRAKSVLGKAHQKATDTVDAMQQRQIDLSRQADEIFDGN